MSEVLARGVKHLGIKVTMLKLGCMATEFASMSAAFGDIGDCYQGSVGMTSKNGLELDGWRSGLGRATGHESNRYGRAAVASVG